LGPAGDTTFPRIPEEKLKTVVDETIADVKARHVESPNANRCDITGVEAAGGFERTSTDECGYGHLSAPGAW
jgi:hypothetical protein